jgi:hypothetical protein
MENASASEDDAGASEDDAGASEDDAGASEDDGEASLNPLLSTLAFPLSAPPSLGELEHSVRQSAPAPAAIEATHALTLHRTIVAIANA